MNQFIVVHLFTVVGDKLSVVAEHHLWRLQHQFLFKDDVCDVEPKMIFVILKQNEINQQWYCYYNF